MLGIGHYHDCSFQALPGLQPSQETEQGLIFIRMDIIWIICCTGNYDLDSYG